MARFQLDRAIDVFTRGHRVQGAASAVLEVPDLMWPAIAVDLASSGVTINSQDYDQAAVLVTNSTTQALTTAVEATITWDTEPTNGDIRGFHSTSSNTGRLTVPTGYDGIYIGGVLYTVPGNATGRRQLQVLFNGGATQYGAISFPAVVSNTLFVSCSFAGVFAAGEYVEAKALQDSGGNLNITPVRFWMARVLRI